MKAVSTLHCLSLCVSAAICLVGSARAQSPAGDPTTVAEQYLLSAANQERATRGLTPLHRDPMLARAAAEHGREMAAHAAISHQFPGEPELSARAAAAGLRFSVISENVGQAPGAPQLHEMWMHSTEHRTNLLDPAIDAAGISVIAHGGELYAVEDFARTVQTLSLEQQESAIAALLTQSGAIAVDSTPDTLAIARQTCAMSTGFAGTRRPGFVMRFTSDSVGLLPDPLKQRMASGSFHHAAVGACANPAKGTFTSYNFAVLLYP